MSRRHKKEGLQAGSWITTYSDMVTLLLTFFVLLYSFSSVDAEKFKMLATSLQSAFTGKSGSVGNAMFPLIKEYNIDSFDKKDLSPEEITYIKANDFILENELKDQVSVRQDEQGVIIEVKDKVLFESGKAELTSSGREVLTKVSGLLQKLPNQIRIEGHTDNVPIHTSEFPSNWELSAGRAMTVMKYLIDYKQVDAKRFSVMAYGEYKPLTENSTEKGRAKNRRVEIILLPVKADENSKK